MEETDKDRVVKTTNSTPILLNVVKAFEPVKLTAPLPYFPQASDPEPFGLYPLLNSTGNFQLDGS